MGIAGSLLVFTGVWHALEWLMGGRNKDTLRLIPFGIVYTILGFLIVTFQGGTVVAWIAALAVIIGVVAALMTRKNTQVRSWVMWVFIFIDIVILMALLMAMI